MDGGGWRRRLVVLELVVVEWRRCVRWDRSISYSGERVGLTGWTALLFDGGYVDAASIVGCPSAG